MDTFLQTPQVMLELLTNPVYWAVLIAAVVISGPIGLIPGVGSTTLLAIAIPFLVLNVDPVLGMVFVAGLISLGNTMDSTPAVLMGYPSAQTQVSYLEGHQLARRGLAAHTLGATYIVSSIGGIIGAFTLALIMPVMRPIMVNFSFAEISAMVLFGVGMVAALSRGAVLRGLAAGTIGVLMATIGTSAHSAIPRFNFGEAYLISGLPLIPVLLGVFALPEIIDLAMSRRPIAQAGVFNNREVLRGARDGFRRWRTIPRQSLFGVFLGAVPGIGGAVIDWLAYAFGIAFSKDKSQFGTGSLDGVLFAESAQSSKEAGQAIPTLAFGIPGGAVWALALAALIGYGISPGLSMLDQHLDITVGIILTIGVGNLLAAMLALSVAAPLAKFTLIPYPFVAGILFPLMFLSAFQASFNVADIYVLLGAGALGMGMKWFGWPRPPLILGFILGPILEANLWTAIQIDGPWVYFVRPWAGTIMFLGVVIAAYLLWMMNRGQAGTSSDAATTAPSIAGGAPDGTSEEALPAAKRTPRLNFQWRWEYAFWLALLAWVGGVVFSEVLGLKSEVARFLPFWTSLAFFVILAVIAVKEVLKPRQEAKGLMDLGMRTGTDRKAALALARMGAWIAGFLVLMGFIGFQVSTMVFAAAFILGNLDWPWRRRLLWAMLPVGILAVVVFGVLENALHPIWPNPFIRDALFS